jgi:hypothetical protein
MAIIPETATSGLFKLQGSWKSNDFTSPAQIHALEVYLTMPSLD